MDHISALPAVETTGPATPESFAAVIQAGRPILLKGLVADWPAVGLARTSAQAVASYLKSLDNGQPTTVMEGHSGMKGRLAYAPDMHDFNFHKRSKTVSAGIDQLLAAMDQPNPFYTYIQSTPTPDHLPRFAADHPNPVLPPQIVPRIWISNATRAQTHNDHDHNLACVAAGHRRFILFPPEQVKNLYIGPMDHTPSGRAISLASLEEPDFAKFPRLKDALETAQVAQMEPGDALYVPKYWWHHVQSLDTFNVLVNYWWGGAPDNLLNPMAPFLSALLALKDLPPSERSYWQAMFAHYIFQMDGDPVAHIPPTHRGGLGRPTAQTRAALMTALKKMAAGS
ncbi:transcription factor jumonji domain-containing protein [Asticcacaulis biprosthecium C19]|uniref:Transcription factor jumonji domain-containing protein n=1 Tax=Asticcacaulis biprosthecium C19 TaxID=715226 RepID=F4QN18_9CAUL|nr:cupin-like domain-containing protein [Asticcacaulis biprosthecium]EGF91609.1 transcription factor jumonji domain-containing protein [Asticcacaulis biprosthecium C19]